jgi:hypothetical protein
MYERTVKVELNLVDLEILKKLLLKEKYYPNSKYDQVATKVDKAYSKWGFENVPLI